MTIATKHKFWMPGEPECPRELKAPNGELHTLRCKVCGQENPDSDACATLSVPSDSSSLQWRVAEAARMIRLDAKYARDFGADWLEGIARELGALSVPDGREAVAQVNVSADSTDLCWIDGAAKHSFDGRIGAHPLYTTPQPGGGWRPIAEAPKDGTLILAATGDGRMMIYRGDILARNIEGPTPDHLSFPATHWMPLPAAPSAKGVAK